MGSQVLRAAPNDAAFSRPIAVCIDARAIVAREEYQWGKRDQGLRSPVSPFDRKLE